MLSGIDGEASLTGIACPDEHLCVAVGGVVPTPDPSSGLYGVVLTSTDPAGGPGTWKVTSVDVYSLTRDLLPESVALCRTRCEGRGGHVDRPDRWLRCLEELRGGPGNRRLHCDLVPERIAVRRSR